MSLFTLHNVQPKTVLPKSDQLCFILILCFIALMPLDMFYSNILLGLLIACTLFGLRRAYFRRIPKQAWLFAGVFLLALAGYSYSTDKRAAGALIERQLAILIMPFFIPLAFGITKERLRLMLLTLTGSSTAIVLFLFAHMLYTVHHYGLPVNAIYSGLFFNHQFSEPIQLHAGYLSLFVALSICYAVFLYARESTARQKVLLLLVLAVLIAGLFFLSSRTIIFATVLILLFILPLYTVKRKKLYFGISMVVLLLLLVTLFSIDYTNKRFGQELIKDITGRQHALVQSGPIGAEPRVERWKGAVHLVKLSPWIGYGTGDEIKMMKQQYLFHRQFISFYSGFNVHNQYLSYALKNGITGLLVFLGFFGYYLYLGLKHRSFVYVAFITLLLIAFVTENVLDRNKGIFFFAFFNTVFGYYLLGKDRQPPAAEHS